MKRYILSLTFLSVVLAAALFAETGAELFQKALVKERSEGNLTEAIKLYQQVVQKYPKDRAQSAKALVAIGQSYEKLGSAEARSAYERVVREFADQPDSVALARTRLAALQPVVASPAVRQIVTKQVWTGGPEMDVSGTVSRDGRFIPYRDAQTTDLMLRDLATGQERRLNVQDSSGGFPVEPVLSPDGKQVAYTWYRPRGLRVAAIGGAVSSWRTLVESPDIEWIGPSDWSPDGKWILVRVQRADHTGQIGLVSASDGSYRALKSMDWDVPSKVLFSPDGKFVAYDQRAAGNSSQRDIFIIAADGSSEAAAVVHPGLDTVVAWAPDGRFLLFWSNRTGRPDLWSIPIRDGRTQGPPELAKSDVGDLRPMGMTQGGTLYFALNPVGPDLSSVSIDFDAGRVTAPPTSPVHEFVGTNGQPEWSRDGKYLAYISVRPTKYLLVIQTMETGQTRELEPKLKRFNVPRWSPDGTAFIAQGIDDRGRQGAYRIDAVTGKADLIVEAARGVVRPQWLDARRIIYLTAESGGTWHERDLASGRVRTLPLPGLVGTPFMRLSPDGRSLAYVAMDPETKQRTLRVFPMDGGESWAVQPLNQGETISPDTLAWTADGAWVLYVKQASANAKQELWQVPRAGGQARKIELSLERVLGLAVHPDGTVVFSSGSGNREVWALENFLPSSTVKP